MTVSLKLSGGELDLTWHMPSQIAWRVLRVRIFKLARMVKPLAFEIKASGKVVASGEIAAPTGEKPDWGPHIAKLLHQPLISAGVVPKQAGRVNAETLASLLKSKGVGEDVISAILAEI